MTRSTPRDVLLFRNTHTNGDRFDAEALPWQQYMAAGTRKASRSRRDAESWEIWGDYLDSRQLPLAISALLPGTCWPLAWSIPAQADRCADLALLTTLERFVTNRRPRDTAMEALLRQWLDGAGATATGATATGATGGLPASASSARADELPVAPPDCSPPPEQMAIRALEAIGWCHALPKLAKAVSSTSWWELFETLLRLAAAQSQTAARQQPLVHSLLAGELRLTLAYLLPEMPSCRRLAGKARQALSGSLTKLLPGEGTLAACHLELLGPLLACWTRAAALGQQIEGGCFTELAQRQYDRVVGYALQLRRADQTPVLSRGSAAKAYHELFAAALRLSGDNDNRRMAAALGKPVAEGATKRSRDRRLPKAAWNLESAALAVLRSDWSKSCPWLTVAYPEQSVRMELNLGATVLWSGNWDFEIQRDGRPAQPAGKWEQVCWVSDDKGCYLELELRLTEGLRLQRQILLANQDRFLFLADVILGRRSGKLTYRSCLPLGRNVAWQGQRESREGFLQEAKCRVLALPLALPEWQASLGRGELCATPRGLELSQADEGSCMLAPLFFDLDPRRNARPFTWRQLTVAEDRAVVQRDVAAGYRVMVGDRQWLIYRALAHKGNRTLLGHNLSSETMIGRFTKKGEVEPVVEIE